MSMTYHEQLDRKNTLKLRELQAELPAFAGDFFRAMEIKKATNTVGIMPMISVLSFIS